jgi:hypothetical protein
MVHFSEATVIWWFKTHDAKGSNASGTPTAIIPDAANATQQQQQQQQQPLQVQASGVSINGGPIDNNDGDTTLPR